MKKIIFSLILFSVLFSSCCDEKPINIPPFELPNTGKIVLIEELTGVHCVNCPGGADEIREIEEQYQGKVISIAIHAGDQTELLDSSKYDFRCEDGEKIEASWKYFGKPAASINRVSYGSLGIPVAGAPYWRTFVEKEFEKKNVATLVLSTSYSEETRELNVNIAVYPLQTMSGKYRINVALTESHIIDSQLFSGDDIDEEYEFNNVLRDMITPWDGLPVGSNLTKDDIIGKSFSYTLPESDGLWKPENIKVVAFLTGGESGENAPVLNAIEEHIIK